ncbi:hypothetical protein I550_1214 [Mycobacterium intracellulare 1956]|uniref:Uncharacterized protein n=1 Tax=Mycobacterium intracellulare 1956 TaxID=1299331 RepID=X8CQE7_MYCIT|nr:hypothetical protein I550_1214 [Mycobacterium intracellulare 1956]
MVSSSIVSASDYAGSTVMPQNSGMGFAIPGAVAANLNHGAGARCVLCVV